MLFVIVGVIWLSFKPVLAHASCVSSTLLASVKSVKSEPDSDLFWDHNVVNSYFSTRVLAKILDRVLEQ